MAAVFLGWPLPRAGAQVAPAAGLQPTYAAWKAACEKLPSNRSLGQGLAPRELLPLKSFAEFAAVLNPFLDQCRTGGLAQPTAWLGGSPSRETFFNLEASAVVPGSAPFQPFAQRLLLPAGSEVFMHGDLHGDIHSLNAGLDWLNREGVLDGFRVARTNAWLVFLGDYTDRGRHGVEVLYTILRLKLENPERVMLVRGNHEDFTLVSRYGFLAEATAKYGRSFDVRRVVRLFDFLPAVLYLGSGTNAVQCNHGGVEPGYDPQPLLAAPDAVQFHLLGRLEQRRWLARRPEWVGALPADTRRKLQASLTDFTPESPTTPAVLGFMWNDFSVVPGEAQFDVDPGRAFVYGDEATRLYLADASGPARSVRAILRAHQHSSVPNPLMRRLIASRGLYRHWQTNDSPARLEAGVEVLQRVVESAEERSLPVGSVWTFNVSPDSVYGEGCAYGFDTFGRLRVAGRWEDWRVQVINLRLPALSEAGVRPR